MWIVWKKSEDIYIQYFARPVSSWTHHRLLWCWWFRCMARTTENIRRRQRIRWRARHRLTFYALGIRYTIHTYITFHLIIFEPRSAINLICHLKAADPCVWRCYCTVIIWWLCVVVSLAKCSRGFFFSPLSLSANWCARHCSRTKKVNYPFSDDGAQSPLPPPWYLLLCWWCLCACYLCIVGLNVSLGPHDAWYEAYLYVCARYVDIRDTI